MATIEDAAWDIFFDIKHPFPLKGETIYYTIENVLDVKGNENKSGTLYLTDLRMFYRDNNASSTNISVGLSCIECNNAFHRQPNHFMVYTRSKGKQRFQFDWKKVVPIPFPPVTYASMCQRARANAVRKFGPFDFTEKVEKCIEDLVSNESLDTYSQMYITNRRVLYMDGDTLRVLKTTSYKALNLLEYFPKSVHLLTKEHMNGVRTLVEDILKLRSNKPVGCIDGSACYYIVDKTAFETRAPLSNDLFAVLSRCSSEFLPYELNLVPTGDCLTYFRTLIETRPELTASLEHLALDCRAADRNHCNISFMTHLTNLSLLALRYHDFQADGNFDFLQGMTKLAVLILTGSMYGIRGDSLEANIVHVGSQLQTLMLGVGMHQFISRSCDLESVRLLQKWRERLYLCPNMCKVVRSCPNLTVLSLEGQRLTNVDSLLDLIPETVQTLSLALTQVSSFKLAEYLKARMHHFVHLDLSFINLQPALPTATDNAASTNIEWIFGVDGTWDNLRNLQLAGVNNPLPGFWQCAVSRATCLTGLCLRSCDLTASDLASLVLPTTLTDLDLSINPMLGQDPTTLESFSSLYQLYNLRTLSLNRCDLVSLPPYLHVLTAIRDLDLNYNLFDSSRSTPPISVVNDGTIAVMRYLRTMGTKGRIPNTLVKLMVVGLGEVGKTSLIRALQSPDNCCEQIEADDRTVGIDLTRWHPGNIPAASGSTPLPNDAAGLEFQIWDFAGQRVYYLAHQLFLSPRALYVLVWRVLRSVDVYDPSTCCSVCDGKLGDTVVYRVGGQGLCHDRCVKYNELVCEWLDKLHSRVPGCKVAIVATHCDGALLEDSLHQSFAVRRAALDHLKAKFGSDQSKWEIQLLQDATSFLVSSVSGTGIPELRSALVSAAVDLPHYRTMIPTVYVDISKEIESLKAKHWLSMTELRGIISKHVNSTNEMDIEFAMSFLVDSGAILLFRHHPQLRDRVFIDISWIIDLIKVLVCHDHSRLIKNELEQIHVMLKSSKDLLQTGIQEQLAEVEEQKEALASLMRNAVLDPVLLRLSSMWGNLAPDYKEHKALLAMLSCCDVIMPMHDDDKKKKKNADDINNNNNNQNEDSSSNNNNNNNNDSVDDKVRWIVPCLLGGSRSRSLDPRGFYAIIRHKRRIFYNSLPLGFFLRLIVRLSEKSSHTSFTSNACCIHRRGHTAVVRMVVVNEDEGGSTFIEVATSGMSLFATVESCIESLEEFFPGLDRIGTLVECSSCRMMKKKTRAWFSMQQIQSCVGNDLRGRGGSVDANVDDDNANVDDGDKTKGNDVAGNATPTVMETQATIKCPECEQQVPRDDLLPPVLPVVAIFSSNAADLEDVDEHTRKVLAACTNADVEVSINNLAAIEVAVIVVLCIGAKTRSLEENCIVRAAFNQLVYGYSDVNANTIIIPILMPSFGAPTFPNWAPQGMEDMNELIVSRFASDGTINGITEQVIKHLEEWSPAPVLAPSRSEQPQTFEDQINTPINEAAETAAGEGEGEEKKRDLVINNSEEPKDNQDETAAAAAAAAATPVAEDTTKLPCLGCKSKGRKDPYTFSRTALMIAHNCGTKQVECRHNDGNCGPIEISKLLSIRIIKEAILCPSCGSFAFAREDCVNARLVGIRTLLCSEEEIAIAVSRLLPAELFISYNWGLRLDNGKFSTQEITKKIREDIEQKEGLVCWHDIGQLGAGSALEGEIKQGIKDCTAVLMFLDKRYAESPNCIKEVEFATNQYGKYIIPLVLDTETFPIRVIESTNEAFWSTDSPAASLGKTFGPVYAFQPIDFSTEEMREKNMDLVLDRIRSRFHRDARSCEPRPSAMVASASEIKKGMLEFKRRKIMNVSLWKKVRVALNHSGITISSCLEGPLLRKPILALRLLDIQKAEVSRVKEAPCVSIVRVVESIASVGMCSGSLSDSVVLLRCPDENTCKSWVQAINESIASVKKQQERLHKAGMQ